MKRPDSFAFFAILLLTAGGLCGQPGPLVLSRQRAIELALAADAGSIPLRESREALAREKARRQQSRSGLLPQISAGVRQSSQTTNLEALGLRPQGLFRPPGLVGPFATFDARLSVDMTLFSLPTIQNLRAADRAVARQQDEGDHIRDRIASRVSRLYVTALRRQAELEAASARLVLAEDLFELVRHQRSSGIGTAIEETRAGLEVVRARQRRLSSQLETRDSLRELAKFLALDLNRDLSLSDSLEEVSPQQWSYPVALGKALAERKDLQALEEAVAEARQRLQAARSSRYPELHGFAQYGTVGSAISNTIPTWAVGAELQIPIYRGGRTESRIREAASLLRSRELAVEDLRRQIELEVLNGLDQLDLSAQQIALGRQSRQLAEDEVTRAERRYRAGIATNLEVVEAQTRLKEADDALLGARFAHQLARIELGETLGIILSELP